MKWCLSCGKTEENCSCSGSVEYTDNIAKAYKAWIENKNKERQALKECKDL